MARKQSKSKKNKKIELLGVPMDLGADLRGVDMGPSAIRIAGLSDRLSGLGFGVKDLGNLTVPHASVAGGTDPKLKYINSIRSACQELAASVERSLDRGVIPLVLGGDHSIAIGTTAGVFRYARKVGKKMGLLWVDAHGDFNTGVTSPSGNIHGMSLAVALGMGDKRLTTVGGKKGRGFVEHTALLAVRELDRGEKRNLKKMGAQIFTMRAIDEHGVYKTAKEALRVVSAKADAFHLSFDIDCVDPRFAPGVGTPVSGGLTIREAHLIMEMAADTGKLGSCELVEVNPVLDQQNITAELAVDLLYSAFGGRIL